MQDRDRADYLWIRMKFGSINKHDTANIPEIEKSSVTLLWVNDFYDGILTGMAEVRGVRYLFDLVDWDILGSEEEDRYYWLIELTPSQLRDEERWHELFCHNVGTHFDFTGRPPTLPESVNMDAFYLPYRQRIPPDYTHNLVVGWFRL